MPPAYPACFDSQTQFDQWNDPTQERVDMRVEDEKRSDYCHDCTFAYQQRMIRQGRCAFPGTVFELRDDTSDPQPRLVGIRPAVD